MGEETEEYTILQGYEPGAFFGEHEFLGLSETRQETIQAVTYCELSALKPQDIEDILDLNPLLARKLELYATMQKQFLTSLNDSSIDSDMVKRTLENDLNALELEMARAETDMSFKED